MITEYLNFVGAADGLRTVEQEMIEEGLGDDCSLWYTSQLARMKLVPLVETGRFLFACIPVGKSVSSQGMGYLIKSLEDFNSYGDCSAWGGLILIKSWYYPSNDWNDRKWWSASVWSIAERVLTVSSRWSRVHSSLHHILFIWSQSSTHSQASLSLLSSVSSSAAFFPLHLKKEHLLRLSVSLLSPSSSSPQDLALLPGWAPLQQDLPMGGAGSCTSITFKRLISAWTLKDFQNYATMRRDRSHGGRGGLVTLVHHSISFKVPDGYIFSYQMTSLLKDIRSGGWDWPQRIGRHWSLLMSMLWDFNTHHRS